MKLIEFFEQHKAAAMVAAGWLVREWHVQWPRLVAIYPTVVRHGGLWNIVKAFFTGPVAVCITPPIDSTRLDAQIKPQNEK